MNNKIPLLILIVIAFIISCSNNNTNPNNSQGVKEKTELGNVETPTDNGSGSGNNGNTDNNNPTDNGSNSGNTSSNDNGSDNEGTGINNNGDKPTIEALNGIVEYGGKGQLNIKLLDGIHAVGPEDIQVYVDIYEEDKIASVHARGLFNFDNIKLDNNKNTYYSSDYKGNYTLTMRFGKDSITDFQVIIHFNGDNYKYYVTADKLDKIIRN